MVPAAAIWLTAAKPALLESTKLYDRDWRYFLVGAFFASLEERDSLDFAVRAYAARAYAGR